MKYIELLKNRYALILGIIALLALLCIMSTSDWTMGVILIKVIGFALVYVYSRLFKKWDREGKVDCIKELFNDEEN